MHLDFSSPAVIIGAVVLVALICVGIFVAVDMQRKKTAKLRSRFGPEYDRLLRETGSRKKTEEILGARLKRIEVLKIRDLTAVEHDRYLSEWELVQSRFIDHPRGAVTEANDLMNSLLMARGYPAAALDQRAEDISVHHSSLVEPYRNATFINSRAARNEATTEELRSAMIHYRALFDALLGTNTKIDRRKLAS